MFTCLHVWLSREFNVLAQLRIWPSQVWECHCDKITQTSHNTSITFVEIGFGGRVKVIFWQSCFWFYWLDTWKVNPESKSTPNFFDVLSLRKLCSTCDQVSGNFASNLVFEWTFIGAIKCLVQTFAKSVEDLSIVHAKTKSSMCAQRRTWWPSIVTFHILFSNPTVLYPSRWRKAFMVVYQACCHELLMAFRIRVLQGDTRWEDLPHSQVGQISTHCHCPSSGKSSPCVNAWEMSTWSVTCQVVTKCGQSEDGLKTACNWYGVK